MLTHSTPSTSCNHHRISKCEDSSKQSLTTEQHKMLVSLTVGKVDAGVAVLLTEDKRLVREDESGFSIVYCVGNLLPWFYGSAWVQLSRECLTQSSRSNSHPYSCRHPLQVARSLTLQFHKITPPSKSRTLPFPSSKNESFRNMVSVLPLLPTSAFAARRKPRSCWNGNPFNSRPHLSNLSPSTATVAKLGRYHVPWTC